MNKDIKNLYKELKIAKETPKFIYTLSSAEICLLVEYIESTQKELDELRTLKVDEILRN